MFGQSVHPKGLNPGKNNLSSFCPFYIQALACLIPAMYPFAEFARNKLATRTVCVFKALFQKFSWETSLSLVAENVCQVMRTHDGVFSSTTLASNNTCHLKECVFHFPSFHGILISPFFH